MRRVMDALLGALDVRRDSWARPAPPPVLTSPCLDSVRLLGPRRHFLPISDYGAIGNLRTVALVGRNGSIDWCCLPHTSSPSVFAALLDDRLGGRFRVAPVRGMPLAQHYVEDTNVLQTVFGAERGRLTVTDFMPLWGDLRPGGHCEGPPQLHRILSCEGGEVEVEVEWSPRFDYARAHGGMAADEGGYIARAGDARLSLRGLPVRGELLRERSGPVLRARFRLSGGQRVALVCSWGEDSPRASLEGSCALRDETVEAWRHWLHKDEIEREWAGSWYRQVVRSELVLKLLTHAETGAFAAAPTTSLPEVLGGRRNFDYRYCWIRDASMLAQALMAIGHVDEMRVFFDWAERVSEAEEEHHHALKVVYGLHGEVEAPRQELPHLHGYRGSRPVRTGNSAFQQRQLDIYGDLLSGGYELARQGGLVERTARFLSTVADRACREWRQPDHGCWEMASPPRHFVYSKVKVWECLTRALHLAEMGCLQGDVALWRRTLREIRVEVLRRGYDPDLGAFVMAYESKELDAANLVLPLLEFLPFEDPRIQGTIDRTLEQLTENGLVYRYRADDGLPGAEGAFGMCTFWMVDALTLSGRLDEALEIFEGMLKRANHLGLYAEQIDPRTGGALGNFPQAFTHLGLINSALYLAYAQGRELPVPSLLGTPEHRRKMEPEHEGPGGTARSLPEE